MSATMRWFAAAFAVCLAAAGCAGPGVRGSGEKFRVALLGNTNPVSPYVFNTDRLSQAVSLIRAANPVFTVHFGNMVFGGHSWMGITEKDMTGQFRKALDEIAKTGAIVYTLAGKKDLFNNSEALYLKATGKKMYYSFNYGNTHFIVLDTVRKNPELIDSAQLAWLKNDLARHCASGAIFVFSHSPLVPCDVKKKKPRADELHTLFIEYGVRAVFSGVKVRTCEAHLEGVSYYNLACTGYGEEDRYRKTKQFYLIDIAGRDVKVDGVEVPYPHKTY